MAEVSKTPRTVQTDEHEQVLESLVQLSDQIASVLESDALNRLAISIKSDTTNSLELRQLAEKISAGRRSAKTLRASIAHYATYIRGLQQAQKTRVNGYRH